METRITVSGIVGSLKWLTHNSVAFEFITPDSDVQAYAGPMFCSEIRTGARLKLYGFEDQNTGILRVKEMAVNPPKFSLDILDFDLNLKGSIP